MWREVFSRLLDLVLAASMLFAISLFLPPGQAQAEAILLEIELDAFSGRPNPRWELTRAQEAEFLAQLRALRPTQGSHFESEGLGYRGFIVRPKGEPVDGFNEVRLCRGTIIFAQYGDRTETFSDPKRVLERWLLTSARGHVSQSVLQYIQNEMGR